MSSFDPDFDVTQVNSMQWNRTIQLKILDEAQRTEHEKPLELSPEVLERVRSVIREELEKAYSGREGIRVQIDDVTKAAGS